MNLHNYFLIGCLLLIAILVIVLVLLFKKIKSQKSILKDIRLQMEKLKENFISTSQNKVLSKILKISLGKNDLTKSCMSIVEVILMSFNIDFCTILIPNNRKKHKIVATNIKHEDDKRFLEKFTNEELSKGKDPVVLWCKHEALVHRFAAPRGIKYYFLIPLEIENSVIGSIVIEKYNITSKEEFEEDFFKIVINNITVAIERFKDKEKIAAMAMKDGLTNIYNRNYMNNLLAEEIKKHSLRGNSFSLVVFDIDHFKKFNDTYGHLFGDEVLKSLAKFFKKNIRTDDKIFRYGGEEFVLFLPDSHSKQIFDRLEKLREGLSRMPVSMKVDGEVRTVYITASFGISEYPKDGKGIKDLIEKADMAAYHSKRTGRDKVTIYTEKIGMEKGGSYESM